VLQYPPDSAGKPGDPPWYTTDAVKFLDSFIKKDTRVLEFGAGRSTVWLNQRTDHLISVETDPLWAEWARQNSPGADVRHRDPPTDYLECDSFPAESFDLVIVDGHDQSRVPCVQRTPRILKRGGILLFDNAERIFHRPTMVRCGQDLSAVLEVVDGWEMWWTIERPMVQHGHWYTVWWQRP
jgi:predicted O-methyltransferase YrrM